MMNVITSLLSGGIADAVTKIVGLFKVDPTVAAQQAFELQKIQAELEEKLQDAITREVEAASDNIKAEAGSGDKYTSRARPTFLYVCNTILVWNYILRPMLGGVPLEFPEPLFWLFGSVMLGYVGARTWEKVYKVGEKG